MGEFGLHTLISCKICQTSNFQLYAPHPKDLRHALRKFACDKIKVELKAYLNLKF